MNRSKVVPAILLLGVLSVTLFAEQASAAVPTMTSYQGFLDEANVPVNGSRNLYFVLYGSATHPDSLWSESHPGVTVDRGVFNVELGSIQPLTAVLVDRPHLYLETRVDGTVLSPRKRLDSVPYALVSVHADSAAYAESAAHAVTAVSAATATFAGHAAAADSAVFAIHAAYADSAGAGVGSSTNPDWEAIGPDIHNLNPGNVGIGTSTPARKLHIVTSSFNPAAGIENGNRTGLDVTSAAGVGIIASGWIKGVEVWANGAGGVGVFGGADSTGATIGVSGYATSPNGRGVYGEVASPTGPSTGVLGEASSPAGYGVAGMNLATTGAGVGVYGTSAGSAGFGVKGSGASAGVFGTATDFSGRGVRGEGEGTGVYGAATGSGGRGVHGTASGLDGRGLYGSAASGIGVYGSGPTGGYFTTTGNGPNAHAVSVESSAQYAAAVNIVASGAGATALYAEATDTDQTSGYGGHFVSRGMAGAAVFGDATSTTSAVTGNYGGLFCSSGESGGGILAWSDAVSGNASGVRGYHVESDNLGNGVSGWGNSKGVAGYAYGSDTYGVRFGVYGSATGGTTGYNAGVYGVASGGGAFNYAGCFSGDVEVTGTLSKGGGSFKIDHPLDPANKYLQHSFIESPDMMNVYNGNVILDASGQAAVSLPDYFETLNRDFRYQLTCIGGFAPVYVADKVLGNRFRIAGGTPGLEVSWQVTGIRQDAFANAHRIRVEIDKPPMEPGTYPDFDNWRQIVP
jgi:hypothetical protein